MVACPGRPRTAARRSPGLPTFTDETTGVLPVTLAGARSAVSFLRSQDAGRTWRLAATVATRRPITTARLVPATVVDSSTWLAALEGGRRFVVVADGGASRVGVVPRSLPFGGSKPPVAEMRFASASAGWAQIATRCPLFHEPRCPDRQAVYRTADGGANWARLSPP